MAGVKGRGSASAKNGRLGGRPPKKPPKPPTPPASLPALPGIDWGRVEYLATRGIPETDIRLALKITPEQLNAADTDRLKAAMAHGHACNRIDLELRINERSAKSKGKKDGAVNILKLLAKEKLGWEKDIPTQELEPDLGTARNRLGEMFLRLARQTSHAEGRHVSVLELLKIEADHAAAEKPEA